MKYFYVVYSFNSGKGSTFINTSLPFLPLKETRLYIKNQGVINSQSNMGEVIIENFIEISEDQYKESLDT